MAVSACLGFRALGHQKRRLLARSGQEMQEGLDQQFRRCVPEADIVLIILPPNDFWEQPIFEE